MATRLAVLSGSSGITSTLVFAGPPRAPADGLALGAITPRRAPPSARHAARRAVPRLARGQRAGNRAEWSLCALQGRQVTTRGRRSAERGRGRPRTTLPSMRPRHAAPNNWRPCGALRARRRLPRTAPHDVAAQRGDAGELARATGRAGSGLRHGWAAGRTAPGRRARSGGWSGWRCGCSACAGGAPCCGPLAGVDRRSNPMAAWRGRSPGAGWAERRSAASAGDSASRRVANATTRSRVARSVWRHGRAGGAGCSGRGNMCSER
jgi:hypothetical protein